MKALVKYRTSQAHYVSCNSKSEVDYCLLQLKLRNISAEVIDLTKMNSNERAQYPKADFGFERFKKKILL